MRELIPGIEFDFGGGNVKILPPLSLGALQRLQGKLEAFGKIENPLAPEALATVIEATHAALKRNYPDITIPEVAELIDVSNMHLAISSVLDVAGIRRKEAAEEKKRLAQPPAAETPPPVGPV